MSVVVFGSINMDLVARAPRLPAPGETVAGHLFFMAPGGKGANQAVASARLGARTLMVGRVGDDALGAQLRAALRAAGVDDSAVLTTPGASGVAQIAVDERGQNTIIVVPGANGAVGAADIARLEQSLPGARALLLQLEVPMAAVLAAAAAGQRHGATVILDPAPASAGDLPPELYRLAAIITPNESEAAALAGFPVDDDAAAARAAALLHARSGGAVILKLGARGALLLGPDGLERLAPFPVTVVDTVAAGDAFNGALAAALGEGRPLVQAARLAMAAAALAVTRPGAQAAMPTRAEVLRLLGEGE
jgi:ribokinase